MSWPRRTWKTDLEGCRSIEEVNQKSECGRVPRGPSHKPTTAQQASFVCFLFLVPDPRVFFFFGIVRLLGGRCLDLSAFRDRGGRDMQPSWALGRSLCGTSSDLRLVRWRGLTVLPRPFFSSFHSFHSFQKSFVEQQANPRGKKKRKKRVQTKLSFKNHSLKSNNNLTRGPCASFSSPRLAPCHHSLLDEQGCMGGNKEKEEDHGVSQKCEIYGTMVNG